MSKDHTPSDFDRPSGYKSDIEIAETAEGVTRINTSFGSKNHNVYVMKKAEGTHEHFYYDPKSQKSGWHGSNYATKNNHPKLDNIKDTNKSNTNLDSNINKGEDSAMEKSNSFLDRIRVDAETIKRCNEVSRNTAKNIEANKSNKVVDSGRERGDSDGPGALGRESGLKSGKTASVQATSAKSSNSGHTSASSNGGHSGEGGGHGGSSGGQGGGGHGGSSGGQGSGGHGGGGHGGGGHGGGGHGGGGHGGGGHGGGGH